MNSISSALSRLTPVAGRPVTTPAVPAGAPKDAFQAAERTSSESSWWRAAGLGAAAVGSVMLAGCGSQLPASQLGAPLPVQTPEQDQAQALKLEVIPSSLGKIDILRQTHTETHTDSDGNTTTSTENDALQNVGVYLGNGLFLDRGLNLSLVPDRIFHAPLVPQDAEQVTLSRGKFSGTTVIQKTGPLTTIANPAELDDTVQETSPDHTTYQFGTVFQANQGKTSSQINITRQGNTITVEPPHYRNWNASRYTITTVGNTTTVHNPHWSGPPDTVITRDGNRVTVQPQGWGQKYATSTVELQTDGSVKFQEGNGFFTPTQTVQRGENGVNHVAGNFKENIKREGQGWQVNDSALGSLRINYR